MRTANQRREPRRPRYHATIAGGIFFSLLLGTLLAHDHLVFERGPEFLVGRALGAACTEAEQCQAPLGTATRRAHPKTCAASGGGDGACAAVCHAVEDCPAGWSCGEAESLVGQTADRISAHVCVRR